MEILGAIWNEAFIKPMVNGLIALYLGLFQNFGLAIISFTVIIRVATMPLMLRQIRSSRAMSQLQPKLKEIQTRFANDKQRVSQETFKLYREQGISPIGCLGPLVIQMPIMIGLYWSLIKVLPSNPESLAGLASVIYSWFGAAHSAVPLDSSFLGMDLALPTGDAAIPSAYRLLLPIAVGASMWVQQKMMTFPSSDPRQKQTNQIMLWMFPLMFGFFTLQFPTGLALYWVITNVVGISIQYFVTGLGGLQPSGGKPQETPAMEAPQPAKELVSDERSGEGDQGAGQPRQPRGERQVRRRGNRAGAKATGRKPGGGRGRGP